MLSFLTNSPRTIFHSRRDMADNHQVLSMRMAEAFYMKTEPIIGLAEHKTEGEAGNLANVGVHCYSSDDLYHWKDCGIALSVIENDPGHPISKGCILRTS